MPRPLKGKDPKAVRIAARITKEQLEELLKRYGTITAALDALIEKELAVKK